MNLEQMDRAIQSVCLGVLTQLPEEAGGPWIYEAIQVFLSAIRNDMRDRRINGLYDFYVVWARRPEESSWENTLSIMTKQPAEMASC